MVLSSQPFPSARDRLLAAAGELFYAHGINATGVDAIVGRAGVALAMLYKSFGGKDQFVATYLEDRDRSWRNDWEAAITAVLLQHVTEPLQRARRPAAAQLLTKGQRPPKDR